MLQRLMNYTSALLGLETQRSFNHEELQHSSNDECTYNYGYISESDIRIGSSKPICQSSPLYLHVIFFVGNEENGGVAAQHGKGRRTRGAVSVVRGFPSHRQGEARGLATLIS